MLLLLQRRRLNPEGVRRMSDAPPAAAPAVQSGSMTRVSGWKPVIFALFVGLVLVCWGVGPSGDVQERAVAYDSTSDSMEFRPTSGGGGRTRSGKGSAGRCPQCTECPRCQLCTPCKDEEEEGEKRGQVGDQTPLGKALSQLSRDPSIQLVMETGTLNGMGSSYVIAQGLKETGGRLITIEALPDFWFQARKNLATYNVTALLGSPVPAEDMLSEEEVQKLIDFGTQQDQGFVPPPSGEWKNWWSGERDLVQQYELGLMAPLCHKYRSTVKLPAAKEAVPYAFDLMVLDGAEFLGTAELKVALAECKPRYFAFHDAQTFKHWFSVYQLKQPGSGYELVEEGRDEGGVRHAVFKRIV